MEPDKQYPEALVDLFDLIMNPTADAGVELVERLEPVFRNAARYQWLADRMLSADFDWNESGIQALVFEMPTGFFACADCDATIDAAMAAAPAAGADLQPCFQYAGLVRCVLLCLIAHDVRSSTQRRSENVLLHLGRQCVEELLQLSQSLDAYIAHAPAVLYFSAIISSPSRLPMMTGPPMIW